MIAKLPWKVLTRTLKESKNKVPVTSDILNLKYSLLNGQAFSWYCVADSSEGKILDQSAEDLTSLELSKIYQGVFRNYFVQFRTDTNGIVNYRATPEDEKLIDALEDYFQFSFDYNELVKDWKERDSYFAKMFKNINGIRILRQDPFECLIGFICSQNNNIPRITKLIYSLCEKYGNFILEDEGRKYYTFPSLEQLKSVEETTLRQMGFGYRARYLVETIKTISNNGGEEWLLKLRGKDQKTIQEELTALMGIGKKVADCISLFSLDCKESIPVDTHVHQIYINVYKKGDKTSLTDKKYFEIGDFFRERFGNYAGWAHSYLFTTELNEFKEIKQVVSKNDSKKVQVEKKSVKSIVTKVKVGIKKVVTEPEKTIKNTKKRKFDDMQSTSVIETAIISDNKVISGVVTRSVKKTKKTLQ